MATAPPTTSCRDHRRRGAAAECSVCGAPLCVECILHTPVGIKCARCTGAAGGPRNRRRRWAPLAVVAGLVSIALGAYGLLQDGGPETRPPELGADPLTDERPVQIAGAGGVRIGGTVKLPPAAANGPVPGVLLVPGFGPTNRDGLLGRGGEPDLLYRDLSRALGDAGMASFRYDKRGTGQSVLRPDQRLNFDDMVADARAGVSFLAERKGIDPSRLAVVGHEEGGLIAMRLAASDPRVKAVVLVSVPGRPVVDVIADDFRNTHGPASAAGVRAIVDGVLRNGTVPTPEALPPEHRDFFPPGEVPYLRALFSLDPAADARALAVPVLIVRGGLSTGISAADSDRLVQALGGRAEVMVSPHSGPTLSIPAAAPPGASGDHQQFHTGVAGPQRDRAALGDIATWLRARLAM